MAPTEWDMQIDKVEARIWEIDASLRALSRELLEARKNKASRTIINQLKSDINYHLVEKDRLIEGQRRLMVLRSERAKHEQDAKLMLFLQRQVLSLSACEQCLSF